MPIEVKTLLSEIRQAYKDKQHKFPFMCENYKIQSQNKARFGYC